MPFTGEEMSNQETKTWPELAIGLYDQLTARNAEITYEFEEMAVQVPSSSNAQADHALWKVDGTIKVRTRDNAHE